ncbi:MAG: hypothetical protein ABJC55_05125, partial [Algoriphagus sp.]
MPKETIFISSVQKEFAEIRQAIAAYVREDDLLKLFFGVFLFSISAERGLRAPDFEDNKSFLVTV